MAGQAEVFAEKIKQQMAAADYGGALETLAASISAEVYDAGCMYEGACAYFMLGDYARAAQWVQNTLQYAPDHAAARLLLARICILEDRVEDGLAIFEFVLAHEAAQLTQQQREDMEDILAYYGMSEASLVRKYPHVAAFLHVEAEEDAETVDEAPSAAAALAAEAGETAVLTAIETENVPAAQPVAEAGSTEQSAAEEMPEASERTKAAPEAADTAAAEHQLTDILASQAGVAQKVHTLNAFAGGFFVARAYGLAQRYLSEALQLDTASAETLRNLAVLAHVQGDDDRALKFASALPETDFLLLASLRG